MSAAYPVILRAERRTAGDLFAVFPTIRWDHAGQHATVFSLEAGHGAVSRAYYNKSRLAREEEAATLCAALLVHGYTFEPKDVQPDADEPTLLVLRRRWTYAHDKARRAEARNITATN